MLSLSLDIIHKLSCYIRYTTRMFSAHYTGGPWGHAGRGGRCGSAHNDDIQQWNDFVFNSFKYPCKLFLRTHLQYLYSLLGAHLQYLPSQRITDLMLSRHWTIYCIPPFTWDHIIPSLSPHPCKNMISRVKTLRVFCATGAPLQTHQTARQPPQMGETVPCLRARHRTSPPHITQSVPI